MSHWLSRPELELQQESGAQCCYSAAGLTGLISSRGLPGINAGMLSECEKLQTVADGDTARSGDLSYGDRKELEDGVLRSSDW